MDIFSTIIRFFQGGGIFMYPILIFLALGSAIVIERMVYLFGSTVKEEDLWLGVKKAMNAGKLQDGMKLCANKRIPLCHVLGRGLDRIQQPWTPDELRGSLEEVLLERIPLLERRTHYLPILANVSTLLGLLGTIIGLIQAFSAIAAVDPSQKAALLAQGISVAMSTTAFGLMVAIPLLLSYAWLSSKTNRIMDKIDEITTKFMNLSKKLGGFRKEGESDASAAKT